MCMWQTKVHAQESWTFCEFICADEDDLREVISELYGISHVFRLGLFLGIRFSALKKIEEDYRSSKQGLRRVIYHWLIRRDIKAWRQGEHPTWIRLANAVSPINRALAMRICNKYCYQTHMHTHAFTGGTLV